MVLGLNAVQAITCGAVDVCTEADGIHFYRLNRCQMEYYRQNNTDYYNKAKTASGIKLWFKTDSSSLRLELTLQKVMGRTYGAVEVFVDGVKAGDINNFSDTDLTGNFAERVYPCGRQSASFYLGAGEKTVCIYFPRLLEVILHSLELEDGASLEPIKSPKKALVFGDSITQGFDCLYPTSHYADRLCKAWNADEYNKAIGGEQHAPYLVERKEAFQPDHILVSYGTNDWRNATVEAFQEKCRCFYEQLRICYPGVPVTAITPVWRADLEAVKDIIHFGPIHEIEENIRRITIPYDNVTVVRGYEFIPQTPYMFGDLRLHPNDEGFAHYGNNLIRTLRDQGLLLE